MFKVLFLASLVITTVINLIFLLAARDKPPDLASTTHASLMQEVGGDLEATANQRLMFLQNRNESYTYSVITPNSLVASTRDDDNTSPVGKEVGSLRATSNNVQRDKLVFALDKSNNQLKEDSSQNSVILSVENSSESEKGLREEKTETAIESNIVKRSNSEVNESSKEVRSLGLMENSEARKSQTKVANLEKSNSNKPSNKVVHNNIRSLNIRVKSSRNHVLVSVDDVVVYESRSSIMNRKPLSSSIAPSSSQASSGISTPSWDYETDRTDGRGIHVVVLNQYDGYIMAKRVFDTYLPGQDDELSYFINMISDGRLLIFAVKDEGSFKMASNSLARELLKKLGSRYISKLRWRDMWAFVVRKWSSMETNLPLGESINTSNHHRSLQLERMNLAEGFAKSTHLSSWAPAVVVETQVELLPSDALMRDNELGVSYDCLWNSGNKDEDRRRLEFCSSVEGYRQVCDCNLPAPISFDPPKMAYSQLNQVPIVVIASNRPHYLYRMLRSLLMAEGVNSSMVSVFIDGFYEEPLLVSRLFNLRSIQQRPYGRLNARISHHYKSSLTATFELFPKAEFAIVFEEDLDIAKDALIYFNQTLDALRNDPSLYCVSAWNDQGYEHSAKDPKLLYRIETMPGLGWMLSKRFYKQELETNWPPFDQPHDWDMWIRTEFIRKGRECIIPDLSRTFHFGSTGTNINSYFQSQYFNKHAFNVEPQREFHNLQWMTKEPYERLVESLVKEASVVWPTTSNLDDNQKSHSNTNDTQLLCSLASSNHQVVLGNLNGPPSQLIGAQQQLSSRNQLLAAREKQTLDVPSSKTNIVIYIQMIDKHDVRNWLKLAKCWRIWDLDARGQHNSMWRLFLNGVHTLIIGSPASTYSRFKPQNLKPFTLAD